ncbi:MAG: hypothetical protein NC110_07610 [Ruminococcus sp.]|nr:hypothetical protein [Ruminococcus sp.]
MKPFNNYAETKAYTEREKIPAGGYICVIKAAEEKEYNTANGTFRNLLISFDVTEGDFKNYYANDYRSQQGEDKRWKGVVRLSVATDDGSERDEWTKSRFKGAMEAIEESNPGYHWDWDEAKLKGKKIGVLLQNREWEFNGNTGWTAQPHLIVSVDKIREGKFKIPKDKPLQGSASTQAQTKPKQDFEEIDDDDLPF